MGKFLAKGTALRDWRCRIREHVEKNFDLLDQSMRMYEYLHSLLMRAVEDTAYGDFKNFVVDKLGETTDISHTDLVELVKVKKAGTSPFFSETTEGFFSHRFLRHLMFSLGFVDTGIVGIPHYTRGQYD